jgi:uncharacterized membrane protein YhhN
LTPLATICILSLAFSNWLGFKKNYALWISIGLFFSLLGDIALLRPAHYFLPGLIAFLFTHIAYFVAFTRDTKFFARLSILFLYLCMAAALYLFPFPGLAGVSKLPVAVYAILLASMAGQALGRDLVLHSTAAQLAAIGALLLCFLAFLFVPINVTAFAFVSKERMNNSTGMINLARNIGGSVGISLVTTLQARLMQRHQVRLMENLSPVNPRYMAMLHGLTAALRTRGSDAVQAAHQAQARRYGEMQGHAAMLSFIDVVWIMGLLCLATIKLMFVLKNSPKHGPPPPTH